MAPANGSPALTAGVRDPPDLVRPCTHYELTSDEATPQVRTGGGPDPRHRGRPGAGSRRQLHAHGDGLALDVGGPRGEGPSSGHPGPRGVGRRHGARLRHDRRCDRRRRVRVDRLVPRRSGRRVRRGRGAESRAQTRDAESPRSGRDSDGRSDRGSGAVRSWSARGRADRAHSRRRRRRRYLRRAACARRRRAGLGERTRVGARARARARGGRIRRRRSRRRRRIREGRAPGVRPRRRANVRARHGRP